MIEDVTKPPELFDPFRGYVFQDKKKERNVEEALPVRIVSFDHDRQLFTVIFSDIPEPKMISTDVLVHLAPTLVADYLIEWKKKALGCI